MALFFWRSLDLEGGAGLVASVVREFQQRGIAVHLLLPSRPGWLEANVAVTPYVRRTAIGTCWSYLRNLRRRSRAADTTVLLDNNPLWHLLMSSILSPSIRTATHISSPVIGCGIFRRGVRTQFVAHWLGKSRTLARLASAVLGFRSPRYVVSTAFQARQLAQLGCPPERIVVQPFGVDPKVFRAGPPPRFEVGRLAVGYLGHFSHMKGVPVLLAAFEMAARDRPGLSLHLAWSGKGGEAAEVAAMIEASAVGQRIERLGRVDVPRFLGRVDVVVLPFRSESIPHLPLVLLEALALGVPVITTRVGGLADAIIDGENGLLVPADDPSALATALVELADRPDLRASMRDRIVSESPERFSTKAFCTALLGAPDPVTSRVPDEPAASSA